MLAISLTIQMREHTVILVSLVLALAGCSVRSTGQQTHPLGASKNPTTVNITESLRAVPVPVPQSTAYDSDVHKKDAYLSGFRDGWEKGITGMVRYASFGSPTSLAPDLVESWAAGWKAGSKAGADRWLEELGKVLDALRTNHLSSGQ